MLCNILPEVPRQPFAASQRVKENHAGSESNESENSTKFSTNKSIQLQLRFIFCINDKPIP